MLSPTIAPSAASEITAAIEKWFRDASTPAATSAVSPGTHTPADSRVTIRKRNASPYWSTMCSTGARVYERFVPTNFTNGTVVVVSVKTSKVQSLVPTGRGGAAGIEPLHVPDSGLTTRREGRSFRRRS